VQSLSNNDVLYADYRLGNNNTIGIYIDTNNATISVYENIYNYTASMVGYGMVRINRSDEETSIYYN